MFPQQYDDLRDSVSGRRALRYLQEVTRFHRIQVSGGFRRAAECVAERLEAFGLRTEVLTYVADGENAFWGQPPLPLDWKITRGTLHLVRSEGKREKLCDFAEDELSVIQRTGPTPPGGLTAEVVAVPRAHLPASYEDRDVRDKFVLCDADPDRVYRTAVRQFGAAGIIVDAIPEFPPVRRVMDLPDARGYRSFWFRRGDEPCPGFILTPRQGEQLRRLLRRGQTVRLHAEVSARFAPGEMQVVSAQLPGETDEEVLITAHLCHPRPSANDNASGVAAGMEAARALRAMLDEGQLPPLRRGIRFLFLAEMAGTHAFLSEHEDRLSRWVAGLNLDMVGQDQDQCGSTLLAEHPPRATPNFAGDLAGLLLEWVGGQHQNLAGTARYPSFRRDEAPFSGGSDHMILSDPAVGIPSPMIIQWPDRFYHTSEDGPDRVDPAMLGRVGALTAAYAHFAATAGAEEAGHLAGEMIARTPALLRPFRARIRDHLARGDTHRAEELLRFFCQRREADLESLRRLGDISDQMPFFHEQLRRQVDIERRVLLRAEEAARSGDEGEKAETGDDSLADLRGRVPVRRHKSPPSLRKLLHELSPERRRQWAEIETEVRSRMLALTLAIYWADGERDLAEISRCVQMECGHEVTDYLQLLFGTLEELELVEIR